MNIDLRLRPHGKRTTHLYESESKENRGRGPKVLSISPKVQY